MDSTISRRGFLGSLIAVAGVISSPIPLLEEPEKDSEFFGPYHFSNLRHESTTWTFEPPFTETTELVFVSAAFETYDEKISIVVGPEDYARYNRLCVADLVEKAKQVRNYAQTGLQNRG